MDPELVALASTAATALVGRLATDGWEQAKQRVTSLWRRRHPEQPEESETVAAQLTETREELLAARQAGDGQAEQDLAIEWRARLRDALRADPSLAAELRSLVAELKRTDPEPATGGNRVTMQATASDHAKIFMSGDSMHITGQ
ncbi:hypothetical protein [Kitasatospora kifunensis]|uniref:Uncharacterized protein n=1 Tax=Kitasatospora kifunensis TaxID=58351 RepID=A0A7W7QY36_KITKI|nr:hypothetical protein [Kitasatospora kifunensis]MBB4921918.1 hypothetical protein [Kitasatospora kifunensis]